MTLAVARPKQINRTEIARAKKICPKCNERLTPRGILITYASSLSQAGYVEITRFYCACGCLLGTKSELL